jgi:hypothetical protein
MNDPIFHQVAAEKPFTAFQAAPTVTLDMARQQGIMLGSSAALNFAIDLLEDIKKPSQQILQVIATLKKAADE